MQADTVPQYKRLEILLDRAARKIDAHRRVYLLELSAELFEPAVLDGRIHGIEELFYLFGANAVINLSNYIDQIRAEEGAAIIEKELKRADPR
jgi:hypothetical protein